jgi:hypothetical protein
MPLRIIVDLALIDAKPPLRALADVLMVFADCELKIRRCAVFEREGQPAWATLPRLAVEQNGFKVWRNPEGGKEPIVYLGEFYPPKGQAFLTGRDIRQLGLGPGRYTVLAPPNAPHSGLFSKWQAVVIPE